LRLPNFQIMGKFGTLEHLIWGNQLRIFTGMVRLIAPYATASAVRPGIASPISRSERSRQSTVQRFPHSIFSRALRGRVMPNRHADVSVDAIGIMARNRIVETKTSRFSVRAPRNPHSELRTREPKTL